MKLLRLAPFIYCDDKKEQIFLFDITNKEEKYINLFNIKKSYGKRLFIIDANTSTEEKLHEIQSCGWGVVDDVKDEHHKYLIDKNMELPNYYRTLLCYNFDDSFIERQYIERLILDFWSINKCRKNKQIKKQIVEIVFATKRNVHKMENLNSIIININEEMLSSNYNSIFEFNDEKIFIELNVLCSLYNKVKKLPISHEKYKFNYVVRDFINISKDEINKFVDLHTENEIIFQISSITEYKLLKDINITNKKNVRIDINPDCNWNKIQEILCYNSTIIHSSNYTIESITKGEWINPLYWGDIYINISGDIYSDKCDPIGNVFTWPEIKFNKLIKKNSLWTRVRKTFSICYNCSYRNLCPPLSFHEIKYNRTFCLMKNEYFKSKYYE